MDQAPSHKWSNNTLSTFLLISLALVGALLVTLSTRWGAGPSPDSAGYIATARNLLSGQGYRGLYGGYAVVWPPLYSLVLACAGLLGPDPLVAARWINVALFGANVLLVGLILRRYARFFWIPVLGSFLAMTAVDLLHVHSMVWTEPLFIFLGLLGLLFMAMYTAHQSRGLLFASAAAVALAALTRYAGLSLVATGALVVLLFAKRKPTRKLADAAFFVIIALLPLACWMARNALVAGNAAGRTIIFHPIPLGRVRMGLNTLSLWLLPKWAPYTVRIVTVLAALLAVIVLTLFVVRKPERTTPAAASRRYLPKLPFVMATFLVVYIAQLILTICFLDKRMLLHFRQLAPAYPPALVLVLSLVDRLLRSPQCGRAIRIAFAIPCVMFALWYANRAIWWTNWIHKEGLALKRTAWRDSELIQQVKELDPNTPVFTNAGHAIYILAGHRPLSIPAKSGYWTGSANERFATEMAEMRERLEKEGGVVVYFGGGGGGFLPSRNELEESLPLRVRTQIANGTVSDGVIYEIAP